MRKEVLFLLVFFTVSIFLAAGISAQNHTSEITENIEDSSNVDIEVPDTSIPGTDDDISETSDTETDISNFEEGVELEVTSGITPDSGIYFVEDKILSKFRSDIENREKKIAEIRTMIQEGKIDEAKIALENYKEYADNLEKEVSPEDREEARRSASAIYNTLKEIRSEIPEEERGEFFDDVIEREGRIVTAVEIAGKIKELCESLAKIDPLEYSRVCKTSDNAPNWQKKLDKDLTAEQKTEAEKFGKIMQQCFETAGQQCACDEIPFTEFANTCSIAAPLATACEVEKNEAACEKLDNLEMPELPEHLQSVFDSLERGMMESQFDVHMPFECREAGATNPRECAKIMIQTNAPEECKQALLDANVQNERQGREICEKIMFELNAPQECIDAGLTNPRECGKFMFQQNAPQECIDAGLTGEHQSDPRKCEQMMKGPNPNRGPGGPGFGGNCRDIQNSEERLKCYDGAIQGTNNFDDRFRQTKEAEKQCAQSCLSRGGAWDFTNGECSCNFEQRNFEDDFRRDEFRDVPPPPQGEFQQPPEGFIPPPPQSEGEFAEPSTSGEGSLESGSSSGDSGTTTESSEPAPSEPTPTGNAFYNFYYR